VLGRLAGEDVPRREPLRPLLAEGARPQEWLAPLDRGRRPRAARSRVAQRVSSSTAPSRSRTRRRRHAARQASSVWLCRRRHGQVCVMVLVKCCAPRASTAARRCPCPHLPDRGSRRSLQTPSPAATAISPAAPPVRGPPPAPGEGGCCHPGRAARRMRGGSQARESQAPGGLGPPRVPAHPVGWRSANAEGVRARCCQGRRLLRPSAEENEVGAGASCGAACRQRAAARPCPPARRTAWKTLFSYSDFSI